MRAVALPMGGGQAVGGALVPGARVDVLAVPVGGRAPAGRATELLAQAAIVLDVRADTGAPYGGAIAKSPTPYTTGRIGSGRIARHPAGADKYPPPKTTSHFHPTSRRSRLLPS